MNHSVSKVQLPSGEFRQEVRIWGRSQGAIRKRFKSKVEAQEYVVALYKRHDLKQLEASGDPLIQTEFQYWLETRVRKDFSPGSQKCVDEYWRRLAPEVAELRVSELTKTKLREVEKSLLSDGIKQKTANCKLGIVLALLNYSVSLDRITAHSLTGFRLQKSPQADVGFWSKEQTLDFLKKSDAQYRSLSKRWVHVVYLMALNTGMRAGEIWGLSWGDVDFRNQLINVRRQSDAVSGELRPTKGRRSRIVPLNPVLLDELEKLRALKEPSGDDLVFAQDGRAMRHKAFSHRFTRDLERFNCQPIKFHGMRHTFATLASNENVPFKVISDILGHKDLMTTGGYVHTGREEIRNVARHFSI